MTLGDDDLDSGLSKAERDELAVTSRLLKRERPVPRAAFRGDLRRRLVDAREPGLERLGRRWTMRSAALSLATGAALLAVAAVGLAGVGPLSPADSRDAVAWLLAYVS